MELDQEVTETYHENYNLKLIKNQYLKVDLGRSNELLIEFSINQQIDRDRLLLGELISFFHLH